MEKEKIEFSKAQFLSLLKAVYLGNWMANAHRNGSAEDPHKRDYEIIEDLIFSYAKRFGFDQYVDDEFSAEGKYYPTRLFEEGTDVEELHDEYDDETFWDELVDRLAERDFFRQYSEDELKQMSQDERIAKLHKFISKWGDEVSKNGIEKLELKSDN